MKWPGKATLAVLVAGCALLAACTTAKTPEKTGTANTQAAAQTYPFGGIPPVALPADAAAMADFLKAEVASDEGDRKNAVTFYQEAAQADPDNASLRLKLASIYVRDGQLNKALEDV